MYAQAQFCESDQADVTAVIWQYHNHLHQNDNGDNDTHKQKKTGFGLD